MRLVRVPGSDVTYPSFCACCLAPATGSLTIRKQDLRRLAVATAVTVVARSPALAQGLQRRRLVQIPYCRACLDHVRWARVGGWLGIALRLLTFPLFWALAGSVAALMLIIVFSLATSRQSMSGAVDSVALPGAAAGAAIGVLIALWPIRYRAPRSGRQHATEQHAVEIARFSDDSITVRCLNDRFAPALIEANPGAAYSRS